MLEFKYRTRGNISPHGKINIFFTCCPSDFEECFDETVNLLLQKLDCAVWYINEEDPQREEYLAAIEEMQLFVVPVTDSLLSSECRTVQTDLPAAERFHIPVLPIVWEPVPDELFARVFGAMHYLDKYSKDFTQISFDKKLTDYLERFAVSDALADQIRDAFDAYVFLSYRKKDRAVARMLMELIHKNPFCRDIAIWYDEYLVPGESFSDSINDAMRRSSLFALAVTPSLLEEDNYVMNCEYPEALKNKMDIIAFELEKTDRSQLEMYYKNLPEFVDPYEGRKLEEVIKNAVFGEQNNEPRHLFFIGLAYLNGIDVEVNRTRAEELISEAAESGIPEAIKQLVYMYSNGAGVACCLEKAAEWQERLVRFYRERYDESSSENNVILLLEELKEYFLMIFELRELEKARETASQIIKLCEESDHPNGDILICKAFALEGLGDIDTENRQTEEADRHYQAALNIIYEITDADTLYSQITLNDKLSKLALLNYDVNGAERHMLEMRRLVSESVENEDALANSGLCCIRLGEIALEARDYEKAADYYREGEAILKKVCADHKTTRSRLEVCDAQSHLAYVLMLQGELKEAEKLSKDIYAECLYFDETIPSYRSKTNLAKALETLGDCADKRGDYSGAEDYYERCEKIRREIYDKYSIIAALHSLNAALNKLGLNAMKQQNYKKAIPYCTESLSLIERLFRLTDTGQELYDLALTNERLGTAHLMTEDYEKAERYYLRCNELSRELDSMCPDSVAVKNLLCVSISKLAQINLVKGNRDEAVRQFEESADIAKAITEDPNVNDILSYMNLAFFYYRLGELTHDVARLYNARLIYSMIKTKHPEYTEVDMYLAAVDRGIQRL